MHIIVYQKVTEMQVLIVLKMKIVWWGTDIGFGSVKIDSLQLNVSYADVWPGSVGPTRKW